MRPDMKEVLITEGRDGSGHKHNDHVRRLRRTRISEEDCGGRESMRYQCDDDMWDAKYKRLGEHLTPLYRYLNSKVGSKWDDIWSEIRANNPINSGVGAHIYTHINVELNPYIENGIVYHPEASSHNYGLKTPEPGKRSPLSPGSLYVDLQGILRKVQKRITKPEEQDICVIKVHPKKYLVKNKKGVWFVFEYNNTYRTERFPKRIIDQEATNAQDLPPGAFRPYIYKNIWETKEIPTTKSIPVPLADMYIKSIGYNYNEKDRARDIKLNSYRQYRLVPHTPGYYCTKIYQASSEDIKRWVNGVI
jgi:hypothetical protein